MTKPPWEQLPEKLFNFNPNYGGISCFVTGCMGSGKTTLLAYICLKHHREAKCICAWRGTHSGQAWLYLPDIVIWIKKPYTIAPLPTGVDTIHFYQEPELYDDVVNVIYAKPPWWRKYLAKLCKRDPDWPLSIFIDEFEDLCPSYASGRTWKDVRKLSFAVKESRKAWINIFAATQNPFDVDYRVREKFVFWVFLPGSKVPSGHIVSQEEVNKLTIGWGIVEEACSIFKKFHFPALPQLRPRRAFRMRRYGRASISSTQELQVLSRTDADFMVHP